MDEYIPQKLCEPKESDRPLCFAHKKRKSGLVCCTALIEMNCYKCAFYKNTDQFIDELRKCEERNARTGAGSQYKKYKPLLFSKLAEE